MVNPRDPILGGLKPFLDWVHRRLDVELPLLYRGTKDWDPPNLATGAFASTTVNVEGALVGDPALASHSQPIPAGASLTASVTKNGIATATLLNSSGVPLNVASGTLRVVVLRSPL
jgi:hypothetical protein